MKILIFYFLYGSILKGRISYFRRPPFGKRPQVEHPCSKPTSDLCCVVVGLGSSRWKWKRMKKLLHYKSIALLLFHSETVLFVERNYNISDLLKIDVPVTRKYPGNKNNSRAVTSLKPLISMSTFLRQPPHQNKNLSRPIGWLST